LRITTLYDQHGMEQEGNLSAQLIELYDGDLSFPALDRPYVIGNFVQTIDGIVSYQIPLRSGGAEISGGSAEDRFLMGLLRSVADAVLVGSGTLHGHPGNVRTAEFVYPGAKDLYDSLRREMGKPPLPISVVLTASGRIDLNEPTFHTDGLKAVIITTVEGAARLAPDRVPVPSGTLVRSTGETGATSPQAVLKILAEEFKVRLLLHEGGPTIFGEFLSAGAIDELFLTLAPQIAGRRKEAPRPGLAGANSFLPETAPWLALRSIKKSSSHLLFLRYATSDRAR
jgi:riboflavin biosynthesis pyrimidine reductase